MLRVHHLRIGRSVFTVWLIEELGLDYELTIYDRTAQMRAPAELRAAHPLGKSPVIEDQGMIIAESGAIATYLIDVYDRDGRFAPPKSDLKAWMRYTQWLHYTEASAFLPLFLKLLPMRTQDQAPGIAAFADGEIALHLGYVSDQLGEQPYILGENLQAPDIGLVYIMSLAQRIGELTNYPRLQAYLARATARPAFQRAMAKTGG